MFQNGSRSCYSSVYLWCVPVNLPPVVLGPSSPASSPFRADLRSGSGRYFCICRCVETERCAAAAGDDFGVPNLVRISPGIKSDANHKFDNRSCFRVQLGEPGASCMLVRRVHVFADVSVEFRCLLHIRVQSLRPKLSTAIAASQTTCSVRIEECTELQCARACSDSETSPVLLLQSSPCFRPSS